MNTETKTAPVVATKASKATPKTTKTVVPPVVAQPVVESIVPPDWAETEGMFVRKVKKENKVRVVRDSFTMPRSEYEKISVIKEICLKSGRHVKKSEVLRAALQALASMNEAQLQAAIAALETIPTGRPKKR